MEIIALTKTCQLGRDKRVHIYPLIVDIFWHTSLFQDVLKLTRIEFLTSARTPIKDSQESSECSNSLIFNGMENFKVETHVKREKMESKNIP